MKPDNDWQVVHPTRCTWGDGLVWHRENNSVLWVNRMDGSIHEWCTQTNRYNITRLMVKIDAISLAENGGLVAATSSGFALVNLKNASVILLGNPQAQSFNNRFNKGNCDPMGRFWAGRSDEIHGKERAGNLYMLHADAKITAKLKKITRLGGFVWSIDQKTFYHIDNCGRCVLAFRFDKVKATLSNKRIAVDIPHTEGLPDGMTIDQEGMLWIALRGGWKLARWNPKTGRKLAEIILPVSLVTSCTFGGQNLSDLYVTSARAGLKETDLAQQPDAGSLFVIENMACGGIEPYKYAGDCFLM